MRILLRVQLILTAIVTVAVVFGLGSDIARADLIPGVKGPVQSNSAMRSEIEHSDINGRYSVLSTPKPLVPEDNNGDLSGDDIYLKDNKLGTTTLITGGVAGENRGYHPAISTDGRRIVFVSNVKLLSQDTDYTSDVYLYDISQGKLSLVSVSTNGVDANGWSYNPVISGDGSLVAFESDASNLVKPDTNKNDDIFLRDLKTQTTRRISVTTKGQQVKGWSVYPAISNNGRYVAFWSKASLSYGFPGQDKDRTRGDVFVKDLKTGKIKRAEAAASNFIYLSRAGIVAGPTIALSNDGRYVSFVSNSPNLVPGDLNQIPDTFVTDLKRNKTTIGSLGVNLVAGYSCYCA